MEAAFVRTEMDQFELAVEDYRAKSDVFENYCNYLLKGNTKLGVAPAPAGSELEKRTKAVLEGWKEFEGVAEQLIKHKESLLKGLSPGVISPAAKDGMVNERLNTFISRDLAVVADKTKVVVDDLLVTVVKEMTEGKKEVESLQNAADITFTAVIIAAILLAVLLGTTVTRQLIGQINKIAAAMDRGADGDFSVKVEVTSGDEIGKLADDFNQMAERLSTMVNNAQKSVTELTDVTANLYDASKKVVHAAEMQANGISNTSSAITQINASLKETAEGADSLSQSASETSSSVLEMAASVEEVALTMDKLANTIAEVSTSITEMNASVAEIDINVANLQEASIRTASSVITMDKSIKEVDERTRDTAQISGGVLRDAEDGQASVQAAIAGMDEIRKSSAITSEVVTSLSQKAENIGAILSVIYEVTEQTSLLALNAAIIAAQAGTQGKGFAVVAEEIKELAERTANSAREIDTLIKGVQEETRRAVHAIHQAEERIAEGEVLSHKSGEALHKILTGVQNASGQVTEIAQATVNQAKESQEIRRAMDQVADMVTLIARATGEQRKGSELIISAVNQMEDLSRQVRTSTREQSKVGGAIAKAIEYITEMIERIKLASQEQSRGSDQIVNAVDEIEKSTGINLETTKVVDESLWTLSKQIEMLTAEISGFKVAENQSHTETQA